MLALNRIDAHNPAGQCSALPTPYSSSANAGPEVVRPSDYNCSAALCEPCAQAFSNSRGLAEDLARWFFQQLIVALDFCHRKGIANRDIKLEVRLAWGVC